MSRIGFGLLGLATNTCKKYGGVENNAWDKILEIRKTHWGLKASVSITDNKKLENIKCLNSVKGNNFDFTKTPSTPGIQIQGKKRLRIIILAPT